MNTKSLLPLASAAVVASGSLHAQDTDPPTPNPPQWELAPSLSNVANTLTMKAAEVTDPSGPVQYGFLGVDPDGTGPGIGGPIRGFSTDPVAVIGGLVNGQLYGWRILTMDALGNTSLQSETQSGVAGDADGEAPTLVSWATPVGGTSIGTDVSSLIYTVTFSETLLTSLTTADFVNLGTGGTVDTVTKTSDLTDPAVYEVVVTPGAVGTTIRLEIPTGRVVEDPATNPLTVPATDPKTYTVVAGTTPEVVGDNRYWDGGTIDLTGITDGVSQGGEGIWNTTTTNWDRGAGFANPIAWNNSLDLIAHIGGDYPNWDQVFPIGETITLDADIFLGLLDNLGENCSPGGFIVDDQYLTLASEYAQPTSVFVWFDI